MKKMLCMVLAVMLALACTGCGSKPAATTGTPQAGDWKAEFSFRSDGTEDYHWTITFTVNEGGETIASTQIYHYQGELTSDTQVSFMDSPNEIAIDKNSFEFSFTEWRGFTSDTYKGKVTFTSATAATGTINIDGAEYEWVASPVSGDGAAAQDAEDATGDKQATVSPSQSPVPAALDADHDGYADDEVAKIRAFLANVEDGVTNAEICEAVLGWNVDDPATWEGIRWTDEKVKRLLIIEITGSWSMDLPLAGALDLSGCTALKHFFLREHHLTELNVSGCTALDWLTCNDNQLTSLDVSSCTALEQLSCGGNQLGSLDVLANNALKSLACGDTRLTALDVSANKALKQLWCDNNQLTKLDLSANTALTNLYCGGNQLTSLDVSANTPLEYLYCGGNQLTSLDISANTALTDFACQKNQLTALDISANTALTKLACQDNLLTSLNTSSNTALEGLSCDGNQLSSLDLSDNKALAGLSCRDNLLTELDVSGLTALETLICENNQITTLNVTGCTVLHMIWGRGNNMLSEASIIGLNKSITTSVSLD